jgi:glycosyltransferase involved in cell wall biosynthesis
MINELSIIIPTLNEEQYLPKLLNSIINQHLPEKLQVIIVDGQSTDNTVIQAERFEGKISDLLIVKTKRGISYQRNRGADKARYKYLLFLDADMILPPNFFRRLLPKVKDDEQFIHTVLLWSAEFDIPTNIMLAFLYPLAITILSKEHYVPGGFILTTKENHEQIHGFDEGFNRGEDIDYGIRSHNKGARLHINFFPYALHSARRLHKRGRIYFFREYWSVYQHTKKHGMKNLEVKFPYPYGDY